MNALLAYPRVESKSKNGIAPILANQGDRSISKAVRKSEEFEGFESL